MSRDTLRFVHASDPPTADVRVYDELVADLLGTRFRFRVIGSSHLVSAPAVDFYELSSCDPVETAGDADADGEHGRVTTVALDAPRDRGAVRLVHEAERVRCETVVERRPLAAFPDDASFDLAHWFGDDAVTTVALAPDGYETYHTYPEFDLALYTRTRFHRLGDAADGTGAPEQSDPSPGPDPDRSPRA